MADKLNGIGRLWLIILPGAIGSDETILTGLVDFSAAGIGASRPGPRIAAISGLLFGKVIQLSSKGRVAVNLDDRSRVNFPSQASVEIYALWQANLVLAIPDSTIWPPLRGFAIE